jgi:hypothetical protein
MPNPAGDRGNLRRPGMSPRQTAVIQDPLRATRILPPLRHVTCGLLLRHPAMSGGADRTSWKVIRGTLGVRGVPGGIAVRATEERPGNGITTKGPRLHRRLAGDQNLIAAAQSINRAVGRGSQSIITSVPHHPLHVPGLGMRTGTTGSLGPGATNRDTNKFIF